MEDNIKMNPLRNRLWGCGQDTPGSGRVQWRVFVNTVTNLGVP